MTLSASLLHAVYGLLIRYAVSMGKRT